MQSEMQGELRRLGSFRGRMAYETAAGGSLSAALVGLARQIQRQLAEVRLQAIGAEIGALKRITVEPHDVGLLQLAGLTRATVRYIENCRVEIRAFNAGRCSRLPKARSLPAY